MPRKGSNKERIIPDFLKMEHEYFFRILGREKKFSLELKCIILVLIIYIPGLVTTFLTGPWKLYVFNDWRRLVSTIFIAVVIWFLVRFLKRIEDKIQHVSQVISPPKREKGQNGYKEWRTWEKKINKYKKMMRRRLHLGYYLWAIGGIIGALILNIFINPQATVWVPGSFYNELFYRAWFVAVGFLTGICLYFILAGFFTIRWYCKHVVSHERILPLDPDCTGGLRELGRLALDLDLIVAIPSVAFPLYLLRQESQFFEGMEPWVAISILYVLFIVFMFFVSISPAHDDMVMAKTKYLLKVHSEYKDIHGILLEKLDTDQPIEPKEYAKLSNLYEMYNRVEKMAVWPLDFHTTLRFLLTSLLPLISIGITIQFPG